MPSSPRSIAGLLQPGTSGLPFYCTPPVTVRDVLGVHNKTKKSPPQLQNFHTKRTWVRFLVFGLLCRHTASNSITSETHTSKKNNFTSGLLTYNYDHKVVCGSFWNSGREVMAGRKSGLQGKAARIWQRIHPNNTYEWR